MKLSISRYYLLTLLFEIFYNDCLPYYLCHIYNYIVYPFPLRELRWGFTCSSLHSLKNPWLESANELYRQSDRRLSAKLVPNFADRGCSMLSVTDSYGLILDFLDRSRCFSFQVAPQLDSRGWVDPVPDPLLLRKSGSAGNPTRTSGSVARKPSRRV
jgi:hypothetical protein